MNTHAPPDTWQPFSPSAAENVHPICTALLPRLSLHCRVLEIGSGTGQHAVHACRSRPDLHWQPSEMPANLAALRRNLDRNPAEGVKAAIAFDANTPPISVPACDVIYTANTLHIMPMAAIESLFSALNQLLTPKRFFYSYGPFQFSDRPMVPSNMAFDTTLRSANPDQGIRSVDWLSALASAAEVRLTESLEMPHNNHLLVWERLP